MNATLLEAQVENSDEAAKALRRHTEQFGLWQAHFAVQSFTKPRYNAVISSLLKLWRVKRCVENSMEGRGRKVDLTPVRIVHSVQCDCAV